MLLLLRAFCAMLLSGVGLIDPGFRPALQVPAARGDLLLRDQKSSRSR